MNFPSCQFLPLLVMACIPLLMLPCDTSAADKVDYAREIRPLLARKCYACHGPDVQEGGLGLHAAELATQAADSGLIAIAPGQPEKSELLARIREHDPDLRMPPAENKPLSPHEISLLERWIQQGAEFSQHWAFTKLQTVPVPAAVENASSSNPIDRFIDAELAARELKPAPPADRRTLIRRLTYDLTGLPPRPEEIQAFVESNDPLAYEQLVDRLLASPQYGEKWARHWLDVVRYAETNSYERDNAKPNAWKYRDYVIRSFNDDKPYDLFLKEQLAGDEFENPTKDQLIATGFYRLGIWDDEPADPLLARYDEFDSIITTISQGMLGLTVNCSRCHDHKIDPIPQADYYSLLAFLQELTPYAKRGDEHSYSQTDVSSPELNEQYLQFDNQLKQLRQEMYDLEQLGVVKMPAEDQRASETGARQKLLQDKLKSFLDSDQWATYEQMKTRELRLETDRKKLPARETVLSLARVNPQPEPTTIMLRGNPHVPGETVPPAFPHVYGEPPPEIPPLRDGARTSGRRTVLANWIASPDNRLTARVIANRLWQHHFGRGIVRTPNNFGLLGTPPTHPELLDWLALRLIEEGWRMKPLHKLIVMSAAYQRASTGPDQSLAKDPSNDYFWRFDLRRLSAEEIRDSVLAVSGNLNLQSYGPSMYPELSEEILATQSNPGAGWKVSSPEQQNRRSIYIFVKRSLIPPELASFDFPETDTTCEARFVTIQPAQSLSMLNGKFLNDQALAFAQRLQKSHPDRTQQLDAGWMLIAGRLPTAQERAVCDQLIHNLQHKHQLNDEQILKYICLYLLNLNEFVFID